MAQAPFLSRKYGDILGFQFHASRPHWEFTITTAKGTPEFYKIHIKININQGDTVQGLTIFL